jgi:Xaa-Pro aminopeptidase
VHQHLGNHVQVKDPGTLEVSLQAFKGQKIQFDPDRSAIWFRQVLEQAGAVVVPHENPCVLPKACKTPQEQEAMRNAHLRDGVNVTKFLVWLDQEGVKGMLSELDVVDKLEAFRRLDKGFRDTSFDTISGWGSHGAIVHYRATPKTNARIVPPGILLLDSGAQYMEGTTDITRTIAIGEPTDEMKTAFTLVLRGHIGIADTVFPEGTRGVDLDVLARRPLWKAGMNYGHGTGHGVGCYLSVHEEGGALGSNTAPNSGAMRPFKPGMVVSNEPGYYKEGAFGIRIENLVLVRDAGVIEKKPALSFETLTLVPMDRRLIKLELMNDDEITWLNDYHARVARELSPFLDGLEVAWLQEATKPLKKPDAAGPKMAPWPFPKSPSP